MFIKRGDAKVLKVICDDEVNLDPKKVKKAIDKSKKDVKNKKNDTSENK